MFCVPTAVSLGHGFGKDSRPGDGRAAYETALVGPFTPFAASELELTATQVFFLGQASTLACVGAAKLATVFLLFELWQPQESSTAACPLKVSVRRGKWWAVGVSTLCTCAVMALAMGGCTYDDRAGRFVIPAEVSRASGESRRMHSG